MSMSPERKSRREQARSQFLERGAKPTGKVFTGRGIGLYAEDVSKQTRSEVVADLTHESDAADPP